MMEHQALFERAIFTSFEYRSDYLGYKLSQFFQALNNNFGLEFLASNVDKNHHWGNYNEKYHYWYLTFDENKQREAIDNINNFIQALKVDLTQEQITQHFEEISQVNISEDIEQAIQVIQKQYFTSDGLFLEDFWVDEFEQDNHRDFFRGLLLIRYIFQYAFEHKKFLTYQIFIE